MSTTALYTDLSHYYDVLCAEIDYPAQSDAVRRLNQIFGNGGQRHLDLACGTGAHVQHFLAAGFQSQGLDINQPMLDRAQQRCPTARFHLQDMSEFVLADQQDLITCFLYSIHYNADLAKLTACIQQAYNALASGGVFCFNAVNKDKIDNQLVASYSTVHADGVLSFQSAWHYSGQGQQQQLKIQISCQNQQLHHWHDQHTMVAVSFEQLLEILQPYFEVHLFEHNYHSIQPWDQASGNVIVVGVKRLAL